MDLILLNDGLYSLVSVTKQMMEGIEIMSDINCFDLLSNVGVSACPKNAVQKVMSINGIIKLNSKGGEGAFREFAELYLQ